MAQKANANSFNLQLKNFNYAFNAFDSSNEYSLLLENITKIKSSMIRLLERHNILVKDCFFAYSAINKKIYLYISFLPPFFLEVKNNKKNYKDLKKNLQKKEIPNKVQHFLWENSLIQVLNNYGLNNYKKIIIFKNLAKLDNQIPQKLLYTKGFLVYKNKFRFFSREPYFKLGSLLLHFFLTSIRLEIVYAKIIAKFLRLYHKKRKQFNKFLRFLKQFNKFLYNYKIINGIRIQFKGRLRGVPRSRTFKFQVGRIPLQTSCSFISSSFINVPTTYGVFGLKIWIHQMPRIFKKSKNSTLLFWSKKSKIFNLFVKFKKKIILNILKKKQELKKKREKKLLAKRGIYPFFLNEKQKKDKKFKNLFIDKKFYKVKFQKKKNKIKNKNVITTKKNKI